MSKANVADMLVIDIHKVDHAPATGIAKATVLSTLGTGRQIHFLACMTALGLQKTVYIYASNERTQSYRVA